MKIINREVKMLTTIDYNNGCSKTIQRMKVYTDSSSTPVLRYKIVDFRFADGTMDETRSYDNKMIIDDSETDEDSFDETDTESNSESNSEFFPETDSESNSEFFPETDSESNSEFFPETDSESISKLNQRLKILLSRLNSNE